MATIRSKYLGNLRTESTHVQSGMTLITDAPVDNSGKGEAFSPTDLVCAAYGSCMMTLMGIYAQKQNLLLEGLEMEITKTMGANPRRIAVIEVKFTWSKPEGSEEQIKKLKEAALTCPVALSVHEKIEQKVSFNF